MVTIMSFCTKDNPDINALFHEHFRIFGKDFTDRAILLCRYCQKEWTEYLPGFDTEEVDHSNDEYKRRQGHLWMYR